MSSSSSSSSSSVSSSQEAPPPSPDGVSLPGGEGGAVLCLVSGLRDGFSGGVMGSIFGFGQGLWKKQGFKGSLKEAGSSAKTFAILSGVHSFVTCFLRQVRGKHDEINAGIAGCATGIVLSIPGTPEAMLRSCATFAAFSYVAERFNKPQVAVAGPLQHHFSASLDVPEKGLNSGIDVLPPFVLAPAFLESLVFSTQAKFAKYIPRRL